MAILLVAVLLTLLLSYSLPQLARLRTFSWLQTWLAQLNKPTYPWFGLAAALGVPFLVCLLVQETLRQELYGLPYFAFSVAALFYCWGPRDLERDIESVIKAPDSERRLVAAQSLRPEESESPLPWDAAALVEASFHAALRRWFGVLFWFVLLGPAGALLYRLAQLTALSPLGGTQPADQLELARRFARGLDWAPAHLLALALALVSDFDAVFRTWRGHHIAQGKGYFTLNLDFLGALARASVEADVVADEGYAEAVQNPLLELADALQLLHRVLIVWLTALALIVLGGWAT